VDAAALKAGVETGGRRAYVAGMAEPNPRDLIAVDLHSADVGDYNVTEPGWYAVDDGDKVVLGPFASLAECERAIRDWTTRPTG
jgi:hypothetical protein